MVRPMFDKCASEGTLCCIVTVVRFLMKFCEKDGSWEYYENWG